LEGCHRRIRCDHLKVTPECDLGVQNDEEDIQVPGVVVPVLEGMAECWEATAIRTGRLAEALVHCCNIVLVRFSYRVINDGECDAARREEMFRM
jgi:hypothetical protein